MSGDVGVGVPGREAMEVGVPGREAMEVGVPGREAVGEHWGLDCGRLTFCLENQHFDTLAFLHYIRGVEPVLLLSIPGTSLW